MSAMPQLINTANSGQHSLVGKPNSPHSTRSGRSPERPSVPAHDPPDTEFDNAVSDAVLAAQTKPQAQTESSDGAPEPELFGLESNLTAAPNLGPGESSNRLPQINERSSTTQQAAAQSSHTAAVPQTQSFPAVSQISDLHPGATVTASTANPELVPNVSAPYATAPSMEIQPESTSDSLAQAADPGPAGKLAQNINNSNSIQPESADTVAEEPLPNSNTGERSTARQSTLTEAFDGSAATGSSTQAASHNSLESQLESGSDQSASDGGRFANPSSESSGNETFSLPELTSAATTTSNTPLRSTATDPASLPTTSTLPAAQSHTLETVRQAIGDSIVRSHQLEQLGDKTQFEMRLDPPELGSVRVRVTSIGDQVSVHISVPDARIRDLFLQDSQDLRTALEGAGLEFADLEVESQDSRQSHSGFDQTPYQRPLNLAPPGGPTAAEVLMRTNADDGVNILA